MSSQSGWANMNVDELRLAAFGEGVPPHGGDEGGDDDDAGMEPDEDEPADTEPESDMI